MSSSVKRACDPCHRRKVKCDGINPCRNCSTTQLICTYHAIPQKKGPKGSRAKVISELRETQRQSTLSSKVANRLQGINSPPCSPTLAPTPNLLTPDMIKECIQFFFANMYPTLPILHRGRLEHQALYADQNVDTYCLLASLCAFMMIQPGMGIPGDPLGLDSLPGANLVSGNLLLEETLRVRKSYDHLETPTLYSLATSYFLFGCYFGLDLHNKAWFHMREATTLAHILNLQKEETYSQFDAVDSSRRRRLYWLLFVTERAYAIQRHRPLSLQATIRLPTENDDPSDPQAHHLTGFLDLIKLFKPFDEAFVALWNKTRTDCSPPYLAMLQQQLNDALPAYLGSTENQTADLMTSRQWLKTMVWQLSIQNGCLSSSHDDPSMTFNYPVEIARDLISLTKQFSQQSMEVHGIGLIQKLFDVACSLTDVLALLPPNHDPFTPGPRDHLNDFIGLLSLLRNGDHRFMQLLLAKVNDVLPRLVNPMLQTVPDTSANVSNLCADVDIFDGFGNAGMGVASNFPGYNGDGTSGQFKVEPDTDFSRPCAPLVPFNKRMEELTSPIEDPNSSGSDSPYESPGILQSPISPMEYTGLAAYSGYQTMNASNMPNNMHTQHQLGNFGEGVGGGGHVEFKQEFGTTPNLHNPGMGAQNGGMGMMRQPPMRQGSGSSYGLQIPRSVPEQYHHLQRANSNGQDVNLGMGGIGDMPFR
ncbi:fungal-specific transcription factor domain-containing protein [Amylocarpus encephaloides]|uniref:Fungal-specific transcription factor domain-containing protein n=1 Tax=Amylocarpus encephaloides TaxID=45428 RepID=A0A9P7YT56_9HELO|nr:fungal-specific transcription factor domain-containing protein [Amylocarpus encephaloides]